MLHLQAKALPSNKPLLVRFALIGLVLTLIASLCTTFLSQTAYAADASSWEAGRIIDDSVFTNAGSMSTTQIRNFIDNKMTSCDTNGSEIYSGGTTRAEYGTAHGNPPPYVCLEDYTKDGQDAADIIKQAAVDYRISPKVILVLLQKEQGLLTDEWPWKNQYRYATGYCVPDSGDLPCSSSTYTFKGQVRKAAWLFRHIIDDPGSSNYPPGTRQILYNPNAACGRKTVTIQNAATSALYHYTPYTPNHAALANLYGTGDSCSAYGNRNFWRYFIDWFGSTRGSFRLIECSGNKYLVEKSIARKRQITDDGLVAWGLTDTYFVPNDSACSYPTYATDLDRLVQSRTSGYRYLVDRVSAFKIQSQSIATAWGMGTLSEISFPQANGDTIKALEMMGNLPRYAESANTSRDYFMNEGAIHHLQNSPTDTDSARLVAGSKHIPVFSGAYLSSLKAANGEGDEINYAFTAGSQWYVFDYGKIHKVGSSYYTDRWSKLSGFDGPALNAGVPAVFTNAATLKKGFRRGGKFFRITINGTVQSTTTPSLAKRWGVYDAPLVSSLLANKIIEGAAAPSP